MYKGGEILLSVRRIILKILSNIYFKAAYSACIFFLFAKFLEKNFFLPYKREVRNPESFSPNGIFAYLLIDKPVIWNIGFKKLQ